MGTEPSSAPVTSPRARPSGRRALSLGIALALVSAVAVHLASGDGFDPDVLHRMSPGWLSIALLLTLVPWFADSWRLWLWSRALGHRLSFSVVFRIVLGTELGASVSPTAVGGAPARVALLADAKVPITSGVALSMFKTVEDGVFFLLSIPVVLMLTGVRLPDPRTIAERLSAGVPRTRPAGIDPDASVEALSVVVSGGILLGAGVVVILLLSRFIRGPSSKSLAARWEALALRFRDWGRQARETVMLMGRGGAPRFALSFALTAVQWSARYSVVWALAAGLGLSGLEPLRLWLLQWVVFSVMTLIPTPGASGGAEAAFALIHANLIPRAELGWLTVGWRIFTFYLLLALGGALFLLLSARTRRPLTPRG